jgi:hypothetical protein
MIHIGNFLLLKTTHNPYINIIDIINSINNSIECAQKEA